MDGWMDGWIGGWMDGCERRAFTAIENPVFLFACSCTLKHFLSRGRIYEELWMDGWMDGCEPRTLTAIDLKPFGLHALAPSERFFRRREEFIDILGWMDGWMDARRGVHSPQ